MDTFQKFNINEKSKRSFFEKEVTFIKNTFKLCKKRNIKFKILGKFKSGKNKIIEKKFYENINPEISFIENSKNRNN